MKLIDTHSHMSSLRDQKEVVKRAKSIGLKAIIAVGKDIDSSKATLELANNFKDFVYPAIGIHPSKVNEEINEYKEFIETKLELSSALGEIGLDFWYKEARKSESIREKQKELYITQLEIAEYFKKPALVHSRGAWKEAFELACKHGPENIVFHWYSGPLDVLEGILDFGYLISATPAVEYSKHVRVALEKTPLEHILIETDSPVSYHGRRTEPSDIIITLKALADLKTLPEKDVANATTSNAIKFFQIDNLN